MNSVGFLKTKENLKARMKFSSLIQKIALNEKSPSWLKKKNFSQLCGEVGITSQEIKELSKEDISSAMNDALKRLVNLLVNFKDGTNPTQVWPFSLLDLRDAAEKALRESGFQLVFYNEKKD